MLISPGTTPAGAGGDARLLLYFPLRAEKVPQQSCSVLAGLGRRHFHSSLDVYRTTEVSRKLRFLAEAVRKNILEAVGSYQVTGIVILELFLFRPEHSRRDSGYQSAGNQALAVRAEIISKA